MSGEEGQQYGRVCPGGSAGQFRDEEPIEMGGDHPGSLSREIGEFYPRAINELPLASGLGDALAHERADRPDSYLHMKSVNLEGERIQVTHPNPVGVLDERPGEADVNEGRIAVMQLGRALGTQVHPGAPPLDIVPLLR